MGIKGIKRQQIWDCDGADKRLVFGNDTCYSTALMGMPYHGKLEGITDDLAVYKQSKKKKTF